MGDRQVLQRMPPGEECPDCGSRRWYLQDGLRFCSRGHHIEGFVEFDVDEEEGGGQLGRVARKEKEARKAENRQLSGPKGKALYLEAVQLLLRNQALWLINSKGLCEEMETVVRDLWDLRIRGSSFLSSTEDEGEMEIFSSTPQPAEDRVAWMPRARAQRWDPERGAGWPMPRLPETIALCYLGAQLLRIPTRQVDLLNWANDGGMPYKTVFRDLPREMQERMPNPYARALKLPLRDSLTGEELSRTVMDLGLSYHLNYDMVFPEPRHVPLLVQYAKSLALPVESVIATKRLAALLGSRFHIPARNSRILPLDHPEIHLVALLVVATKLLFPFSDCQQSIKGHGNSYLPRFDWDAWRRSMPQPPTEGDLRERGPGCEIATPNQVAQMNDKKFKEYLAHDFSRCLDDRFENPLSELFASNDASEFKPSGAEYPEADAHVEAHKLSSEPPLDEVDVLKEEARQFLSQTFEQPAGELNDAPVPGAAQPLRQTSGPPPKPEQIKSAETVTPGNTLYSAFRSVEDLSEMAAAFYRAAGDAAGITLDLLVRAVYAQEQRLISVGSKYHYDRSPNKLGLALTS
ncbi:hypothetical protein XA68_12394 [Ophiocordyceps unilateralis]|uniref:Uncharacterized protein n=1 Tax=Ophiocordyceps unilateralis TaxID=268505 RepID=A0A2A9PPH8_OPHUN|nr:hypothetical protein XA68_12394 [Ophiocordyceps unilateralis]